MDACGNPTFDPMGNPITTPVQTGTDNTTTDECTTDVTNITVTNAPVPTTVGNCSTFVDDINW